MAILRGHRTRYRQVTEEVPDEKLRALYVPRQKAAAF